MQIHKHIHTYFLPIVQTNHRPKNRHLGYLNSRRHPHLSGLFTVFQSSQARFLFLTFKILLPPNCLFNFITNSPAPQPTVLFTVPKCSHHSPTCFCSCCFWMAILVHYQDLACLCGGRLVGSIPDSPSWPHACVMSPGLWCFRGQVHDLLSQCPHRAQLSNFEYI